MKKRKKKRKKRVKSKKKKLLLINRIIKLWLGNRKLYRIKYNYFKIKEIDDWIII